MKIKIKSLLVSLWNFLRRFYTKQKILLLILACLAIIAVMIHSIGANDSVSILRELKFEWILMALAAICFYWLMEAAALHIILKKIHKPQKFHHTFTNSMLGQFYNNVTPLGSGGQPMQAYSMVKNGVSISDATMSLLIKFLIYQTMLTLYSAVILIFRYHLFADHIPGLQFFLIVGFAMHLLVLVILFPVCFFENIMVGIISSIIRFLGKKRLIRNTERKLGRLQEEADRYRDGMKIILKSPFMVLQAVLLTAFQLTAFYIMVYFIYRALGDSGGTPFDLIAVQSSTHMVSNLTPTPGAMGGAELTSMILLGIYMEDEKKRHMAVLLWRLITFYLPLLVGVFFVLKPFKRRTEKREEPSEENAAEES